MKLKDTSKKSSLDLFYNSLDKEEKKRIQNVFEDIAKRSQSNRENINYIFLGHPKSKNEIFHLSIALYIVDGIIREDIIGRIGAFRNLSRPVIPLSSPLVTYALADIFILGKRKKLYEENYERKIYTGYDLLNKELIKRGKKTRADEILTDIYKVLGLNEFIISKKFEREKKKYLLEDAEENLVLCLYENRDRKINISPLILETEENLIETKYDLENKVDGNLLDRFINNGKYVLKKMGKEKHISRSIEAIGYQIEDLLNFLKDKKEMKYFKQVEEFKNWYEEKKIELMYVI